MTDLAYTVQLIWPLLITWSIAIGAGALVSYYGFRAYRSSGQTSLLAFGAGFVLISVGAGCGWMWSFLWSDSWWWADFIGTLVAAVGFLVIVLALRPRLT